MNSTMRKDILTNGIIPHVNGHKEEESVATADRWTVLHTDQAEKQALYDKEIEQLQQDIAYQAELLRAKQAEKKQEQHLQTLREELELLRYATKNLGNHDFDENERQREEEAKKWKMTPSQAQAEWEMQKEKGASNDHVDDLMSMVGLEAVRSKFLELLHTIETAKRQEEQLNSNDDCESKQPGPMTKCFHATFIGNPGTGKTTVAKLYARFLKSLGMIPDTDFHETSGAALLRGGIKAVNEAISKVHSSRPEGVLLIERPQALATEQGREVLDYIMHEMDRLQEAVAFVFAGTKGDMETLLSFDTRLRRRVHLDFKFDDFSDPELLHLLQKQAKDKYSGKMRFEMGEDNLYMRIVSRRIGRGRSKNEFGNVRDVELALKQIQTRQANRLVERRKAHLEADDFFFSKTDLIGLPPSNVLAESKAWLALNKLVGLDSVKEAVRVFIDRAQTNYQRDLDEQPPVEITLNKVFVGSPGTGKTTVAKYYGQILADIGLLSRGDVIIRSPADFIGQAVGESEQKTKAILDSARGNVLIIDEAYGLSDASSGGGSGDGHTGNAAGSYKSAVVDTLVAEVQSTIGEDRCVLLLGYKEGMEEMFQSVNPALGRRFPMSSAFVFEDYSDEELGLILHSKLKETGFRATERAAEAAMDVLSRARNHRNFGNAGEVDIILNRAKDNQQKRLSKAPTAGRDKDPYLFEAEDMDPDFDRLDRAEAGVQEMFADFVGMEDLVRKLEGYQRIIKNSKELGTNAEKLIPFNFLFRGPPGTGKTTVAEKMGQVFYEMGFLATKDVERCSTTNIIGEYVGQTGPKTQKVFEKALGKVLFIDEAYRLADSSFGRDALAEVTTILTLPKYKNKMVTILAGYDEDIDRLMAVNPGLTSRFPEVINFPSLSPDCCWELLFKRINTLQESIDVSLVKDNVELTDRLYPIFSKLSHLPGWGNGRDIETLSENIVAHVMQSRPPSLVLTKETVTAEMNALLQERQRRAARSSGRLRASFNTSHPGNTRGDSPEPVQDLEKVSISEPVISNISVDILSRVEELPDDEEDEDNSDEEKMREFLGQLGVCSQGYEWDRVENGWKCKGGTHFMDDDDVRRQMKDVF